MIQAFAPRLPRGCSWVMLVISGLVLPTSALRAQDASPAEPVAKPVPLVKPGDPGFSKVEKFIDPKAKETLAIFKPMTANRSMRTKGAGNDLSRMQSMAARAENEDSSFIRAYIDYFASELTKRDNINALFGQPPNLPPTSPAARGLETAVDALTRPINDANAQQNPNTNFLNNYTRALFDSILPKLMDNNYFTRIDAAIVLGMAGGTTPNALDFYASQLKLPDQIMWVKMWAARGYTNAAKSGRRSLEFSKAIAGADALVTFLNSDPDLPFFIKFRSLEALGSIRVCNASRAGMNLDVASVVAGFLADPQARPETRAYAAWSLGMLKVPPQITPFNFMLAGSEVGYLTVDLGTRIIAEFDANAANFDRAKDDAAELTSLLMFQVIPAIGGEEGVTESGLLKGNHPDLSAAKPFLSKLDEKIRDVTREAYDLLRKEAANQKSKRDDLAAKVADLKTFLEANKPRDRRLVPGGPLFAGQP